MGDVDRTPEDVIADQLRRSICGLTDETCDLMTSDLVDALAAAGFAVVPQADVDAATAPSWRQIAQDDYAALMEVKMERDAAVDAAARLRALIGEHYRYPHHAMDSCCNADYRLWWAAAAVGSVNPEGEENLHVHPVVEPPPLTEQDLIDIAELQGVTVEEAAAVVGWPARPDRCPTCGSDDPEVRGSKVALGGWVRVPCPDPWHSPDPDRGT